MDKFVEMENFHIGESVSLVLWAQKLRNLLSLIVNSVSYQSLREHDPDR